MSDNGKIRADEESSEDEDCSVRRIVCAGGARPNFVKLAPIFEALRRVDHFSVSFVHTGQHYDEALWESFREDLGLPRPDAALEVGSGSHAVQTAEILRRFEPVLERLQPTAVLVVGDVNSTVACALAAAKFRLEEPFSWVFESRRQRPLVIHVEAGLRSFDRDMPEEINRRLTDAISDLLFVTEEEGVRNLEHEGVDPQRVHLVGNVMIDALIKARTRATGDGARARATAHAPGAYGVVTLHRPSNVDDPRRLKHLLTTLDEVARRLPLVFPLHPRTRARLAALRLELPPERWTLTPPLRYLEFVDLLADARVTLTDSGGVQEEATALGVPCLTLRQNTERPVTVSQGTNRLAGVDRRTILPAFAEFERQGPAGGCAVPPLWDGRAAERMARVLAEALPAGPAAVSTASGGRRRTG